MWVNETSQSGKKGVCHRQHLNQICHKMVKIRVILWGYVPSASCRLLRGRQYLYDLVRILHAVLTVASYFLSLQHQQQLIIFYKTAHKINNISNGLRRCRRHADANADKSSPSPNKIITLKLNIKRWASPLLAISILEDIAKEVVRDTNSNVMHAATTIMIWRRR